MLSFSFIASTGGDTDQFAEHVFDFMTTMTVLTMLYSSVLLAIKWKTIPFISNIFSNMRLVILLILFFKVRLFVIGASFGWFVCFAVILLRNRNRRESQSANLYQWL